VCGPRVIDFISLVTSSGLAIREQQARLYIGSCFKESTGMKPRCRENEDPPSLLKRGLVSFRAEAGTTRSVLLLGPAFAGPGLELEPGHAPLALAPGAGPPALAPLGHIPASS